MFADQGFLITQALFDSDTFSHLEFELNELLVNSVGTRHLLDFRWCSDLALRIRQHSLVRPFLPLDAIAVQCTYFEKSKDQNWLVPLHQDLSIPVKKRITHPDLTVWSEKEGLVFVQPTNEMLRQLVAVRLHIDECDLTDGPLRVVPMSHKNGRLSNQAAIETRDRMGEVICPVEKGGALIMSPLLLHASSKASGESKRRVLHFVYGPTILSHGLNWRYAI
ncbi:phytanoyl-CoA dioxygenase family protein [Undibacterium sp. RTI2.1]|uniref:phytanoyl-CoA dioxygenase family protein n=1 Tax=unclassified Undibacterium TaxID=2630295 RepID=UPI002B22F672|nr:MULTISPECIES: phytanoyl-CoA dioxygenase family protein [unclassified Undibacterium]MEB0030963.1 phytanoyl-CoA dioxygenase family protein [Undibacterium sp. RTI2.1]